MKLFIIVVVTIFYTHFSYGQFNDTTHHLIHYGITGIMNNTNTGNSFILTNGFRFSIRKKSIALNNSGSWVYGHNQSRRTNNDYTFTIDFNLFKTFRNFYYWGLGNFDKSLSLKINKRWQAGLGGAYSFIDDDKAFLNLSNGILYESSDLTINDSTRNVYRTFRNSLRFRYRFVVQQRLVLEGTHFWQPSLSFADDSIIKSINSLSFVLSPWLNVTAAMTYNKLTRTDKENLILNFGLTLERYF